MVGCNASRVVANSEQLARTCDSHDACSPLNSPWSPIRGDSPDNVPRSSNLSSTKNGSTKQANQPNHQCLLCQQSFRRRDNIKPHVRVKHPAEYDSLYPLSTTAPKPSSHSSTAQYLSASDESSATPDLEYNEDDEGPITMNVLPLELTEQTPGITQLSEACPTGVMTPQKRSHEVVSAADVVILDGSETRSATRLKTHVSSQGHSLACPFQKRNPFKYQRCFGVSLHRIKDVKQHVYRCHSSPEYYCAACYTVFDTASDRDNHSRRRECERLDHPFWQQFEGITEDQRKQLSEKSDRTLSEEDQWYQIWDLIFPSQERPRSAYRGSFLGEIVPILRQEWKVQSAKMIQDVDGVDPQKLDCTMEKFFRYLEGETAKYKHQIGDRY